MIKDPIVEEIRKHREEHASTYQHDLQRMIAALQEQEAQSKRPVLNPGPNYLFDQERDPLREVFADALEEVALIEAIREGETTELVDRDAVFALLEPRS